MASRPAFFKFYIPSLGEENQKIPPTFVQRVQDAWTTEFNLRDQYNNLWKVKVEKKDGDWYFRDGWEEFMRDNRVGGGDMVLYEHFSPGLLDFKVHNRFACSTEGVGGKIEDRAEQEMDESDETDDDHHSTEEENGQDDHAQGEQMAEGPSNPPRRGSTRGYDWYGTEIFKTGVIPRPRNPYFVTKKRRNRSYELYLPMHLIRSYNLQLPENVVLYDPHGRQFYAKLKVWSDERTFYSGGGWNALCRMNMVEDDDTCICEFVGNGDELSIRVSFYPPK